MGKQKQEKQLREELRTQILWKTHGALRRMCTGVEGPSWAAQGTDYLLPLEPSDRVGHGQAP